MNQPVNLKTRMSTDKQKLIDYFAPEFRLNSL